MTTNAHEPKCDKEKYPLPSDVYDSPTEDPYVKVYRVKATGNEAGVPILLLHELPGLTCLTVRLAHQLSDAGFTVYMPNLLGTAGQRQTVTDTLLLVVDPRWRAYSSDKESQIVDQIEELAGWVHEKHRRKIDVIGMCLTGSFPIALLHNEFKGAAVVSQPSLPLIGITSSRKENLGIGKEHKQKAEQRGNVPILGFRYQLDKRISPAKKVATLKRSFKEHFYNCEVGLNEASKEQQAHSVLTEEYPSLPSARRVEKTVEFLSLTLKTGDGLALFVQRIPGSKTVTRSECWTR